MGITCKGWAMVVTVAIVAMMVQVSMAQGRRGRGGPGDGGPGGFGFGPPSSARLLGLKEVQDGLKLTDDQKSKIEKINDEMQEGMRKAMQGGGGWQKMQQLMAATSAKVNEVLDAGQQKRLMGIMIQVNGAAAVLDPGVAKELNITDDQKKQLDQIHQKNMEAMRDERQGARNQSGGRGAVQEKMQKLRDEAHQKLMAVLTSDQQTRLESLKGEKVDIDMSQLRGPGGPGGPGGPVGRGPGRRNSQSGTEEKSSN